MSIPKMGKYFEIVAKSQYVCSFTTLHVIACLWIVGHCRVVLRANMVKQLVAVVRNEDDRLRLIEYKLYLMIVSIKSERTNISNYSKECSTMTHLWQTWNCSLITWQNRQWNAQWLHSVNCFLYFFLHKKSLNLASDWSLCSQLETWLLFRAD